MNQSARLLDATAPLFDMTRTALRAQVRRIDSALSLQADPFKVGLPALREAMHELPDEWRMELALRAVQRGQWPLRGTGLAAMATAALLAFQSLGIAWPAAPVVVPKRKADVLAWRPRVTVSPAPGSRGKGAVVSLRALSGPRA